MYRGGAASLPVPSPPRTLSPLPSLPYPSLPLLSPTFPHSSPPLSPTLPLSSHLPSLLSRFLSFSSLSPPLPSSPLTHTLLPPLSLLPFGRGFAVI